jgi:hypothetical protein
VLAYAEFGMVDRQQVRDSRIKTNAAHRMLRTTNVTSLFLLHVARPSSGGTCNIDNTNFKFYFKTYCRKLAV